MKRTLAAALIALVLLYGCAPGTRLVPPVEPTSAPPSPTAIQTAAPDIETPSSAASAESETHQTAAASPAALPERTPDPANEMLVTGKVIKLLDNAIEVQAENLGKDLVVTMLNRAEYASDVSRKFEVGNYVRIITSNKLAKTLPERAAAVTVLENIDNG